MFRKKYAAIIAVLLTVAIAVTGCGSKIKNQKTGTTGDNPVNEGQNLAKNAKQDDDSDKNGDGDKTTKILTENSRFCNMVSTEDGMYRISRREREDGSLYYQLYYVDYASAKEIVLCSDASCKHNTETCMGVIEDEKLVWPYLFIYQDKLYVFSSKDHSGSSSFTIGSGNDSFFTTVEYPAILYQMNLDGSNRKKLVEFPEELSVEETVLQWNGKLIFQEKTVDAVDKGEGLVQYVGSNRKMVSVDVSTGKLEEVCEFPQDYSIIGTVGDKLVCQSYLYPDGVKEEDTNQMEFSEWKKLINKSQARYFLYDIGMGEEKDICTVRCKEFMELGIVFGNTLYLSNGTKKLSCYDLETGKQAEMTMNAPKAMAMVKKYGDQILCWENGNSQASYFFDPVKNKVTKVDLLMKKTGLLIDLCACSEKYIVGICDGEYERSQTDKDSFEILSQKFGLYKKEDLFAGRSNYKPVEMCSDGL